MTEMMMTQLISLTLVGTAVFLFSFSAQGSAELAAQSWSVHLVVSMDQQPVAGCSARPLFLSFRGTCRKLRHLDEEGREVVAPRRAADGVRRRHGQPEVRQRSKGGGDAFTGVVRDAPRAKARQSTTQSRRKAPVQSPRSMLTRIPGARILQYRYYLREKAVTSVCDVYCKFLYIIHLLTR